MISSVYSQLQVPVVGEHDRSAGRRSGRPRPAPGMRGLALAATVITAAALVTGAVAQGAEPMRIVPFETQAQDGTVLRGDVYLPEVGAPVGTVLQLSPYWNTTKGPGELQADNEEVRPFVDAGFRGGVGEPARHRRERWLLPMGLAAGLE